MTNGDNLSIGLVWSSDRMTKKRSEAEDTSFCSSGWSVSTSENDRFGIFVDDEFSIKEEAMLGVLKFGIFQIAVWNLSLPGEGTENFDWMHNYETWFKSVRHALHWFTWTQTYQNPPLYQNRLHRFD